MTQPLGPPTGRQVHVWHARLDRAELRGEQAKGWLSDVERERAGRRHFDRDRLRFVAGHAFLRALLARYLACSPAEVAITKAAAGKPGLARDDEDLRFNLSHSGDIAVVAVATRHEVGVDVELVSRPRSPEALAPRVLSREELAELAVAGAPAEQRLAFLAAWTRKEAVLKASGTGIDRDLTAIDVGIERGQRVVELAGEEGRSSWSVTSFDPPAGYVGAVAVAGHGMELVTRPYEPGSHGRVSAAGSRPPTARADAPQRS